MRPFDLVKVDFRGLAARHRRKYPFAQDDVMLYLGQVRAMPGHLVVVSKSGSTFWGFHEDHFLKVPAGEL